MTATSSAKVWDLNDSSAHWNRSRRGLDLGSPIAAALGLVALVGAMAPGVSIVARWCMVVSFAGIAVLVAISSLRRRQTLVSGLIGLAGLLLPIAAVVVAVAVTGAVHDTVVNRIVPEAKLNASSLSLSATPAFNGLPAEDRIMATDFAVGLVTRIRGLHDPGPYPSALALSNGAVVEDAGAYRGLALTRLPENARLVYSVSASGDVFSVTLVATDRPGASVTATNTGVLPHLAG